MLRLILFILLLISSLAHAQRKPIVKPVLTPTPGIERLQSLSSARDAAAQSPWRELPARCIGPTVTIRPTACTFMWPMPAAACG